MSSSEKTPIAWLGDFALLQVVDIQEIGSFLDIGLDKDLFLPKSEQTRPISIGQKVLVHIYLDREQRMTASMRLDSFISVDPPEYQDYEKVDLIIAAETDLGFKAIINNKHWGVLYFSEVFQELKYGQRLKGHIKKIREDGKIDLILQAPGHQAAQKDIGDAILQKLDEAKGFLPITDKSTAEVIYELFGVSKKKFKIALGGLYKKKLIKIEPKGITKL
jgi:predicted RNA-binding protein (virulence factor B family)